MGIVRNGRNREGIVTAGKASTSVIVDGVDRLEGTPGTAVQFMLSDAGIVFEVSKSGTITLTIVQGSFVDTNYANGDEIGINNDEITLSGSIRVPTDTAAWTNSGELVTITGYSFTQEPTASTPDVTTNAASSIGSLFTTFNGEITDLHDSIIKSTGFYYIEGDSTTTDSEILQGTQVFTTAAQTEVGTFSSIVSGLESSTEYHFLAFAESESLGTGYGTGLSLTTLETEAFAFWAYINDGSPYGGTAGTQTVGAYGDWGGALNSGTTDLEFDSTGKPTSARCDATSKTCSVSRTRTVSTPYTGGSQDQDGVCVFTEGTQPAGLACESPAGDEGDTTERTVSTDYTAVTDDTQTASVNNRDYVEQGAEFAWINLGVSGTISSAGVIDLTHTTGGGTLTHSPAKFDPITTAKDQDITVTVSGVTVPVATPPFQDEGATGQSYTDTYTANQPAQTTLDAPEAVLTVSQAVGDGTTTDYVFTGTTFRQGVDLVPGSSYTVAIRNDGGAALLGAKNNLAGPYTVPAAGNGRGHGGTYTNATDSDKVFATVRGEE